MTIDEEERARIRSEAKTAADIESRLQALEGNDRLMKWAIMGAAGTILASMWDQIKEFVFHGN